MKVSIKVRQYTLSNGNEKMKGYVLILKLRRYTFAYDKNGIVPRLIERYFTITFVNGKRKITVRKSTFRIDFGANYYALVSFLHLLTKGRPIERSIIDVEPSHLFNCLSIVYPLITNVPLSIRNRCVEESTDCHVASNYHKIINWLIERLSKIDTRELYTFVVNSKVIPK